MKYGLIIYIGKIRTFQKFSIEMMSKNVDEVIVCTDDKEYTPLSENIHTISSNLSEINKRVEKIIGRKCEIYSAYKLCDIKLLWPFLINKKFDQADILCIFDLDCLWGNVALYINKASSVEGTTFIGNRGHFMAQTYKEYCNQIEEWDEFYGVNVWRSILSNPKNYAFDEFNYQHKFLRWRELHLKKKWDSSIGNKLVDINYWRIAPSDVKDNKRIHEIKLQKTQGSWSITVKKEHEQQLNVPYIHIQKRNIYFSDDIYGEQFWCNVDAKGCVIISSLISGCDGNYGIVQDIIWKSKMIKKRITSKLSNERFGL